MPEKVTSLNGLKVTSEYWSYSIGALNAFYVKYQLVTFITYHDLMYLSCRDSSGRNPSTVIEITFKYIRLDSDRQASIKTGLIPISNLQAFCQDSHV
ncbi:TPA: hypothetical protein MB320_004824 [Klebsiella pneumoniae]|nr:hypothetical protein [Klebsiella pneumoniae]